jgi:hypothetical protein
MASPLVNFAARRAARIRYLRGLPIVRLLAIGEVLLIAKDHVERLEPRERRRLLALVREGRGRRSRLAAEQRAELERLIAKAAPREFVGEAVQRFSPVKLPDRIVYGPKRKRSST